MKNGTISESGSSENPIMRMNPSPQTAARPPEIVGRSDPRQSRK